MDFMQLAQQLRQQRQAEATNRQQQGSQGGMASGGTAPVGGSMFGQQGPAGAMPQASNNSMADALMKGVQSYQSAKGPAGPFAGADAGAMSAMGSGGGSNLGTIGLQQGSVNFPGAAPTGGGVAAGAGPAGWLALGAKALNDSGVSSYGNTLKGQWMGNITDQVMGDRDQTGAVGNSLGAIGNFMGGDFGGGFDRAKSSLKDLFKLKLF